MKRRDRQKKPIFKGTQKAKLLKRIVLLQKYANRIRRMRPGICLGADLSRAVAFLDLALGEIEGFSQAEARSRQKQSNSKKKVNSK